MDTNNSALRRFLPPGEGHPDWNEVRTAGKGPVPKPQHQHERDTRRRQADSVTVTVERRTRGPKRVGYYLLQAVAWYDV